MVALERGELSRPMASPALVSFLGFPGWPALHLQLPAPADPPAMAERLLRAQRAVDPHACMAALLTTFLRQQGDALPLARPWGALPAGGRRLSHRFRIVCRGERRPPQVMAWCWHGSANGWSPCGKPESLPHFLARFASGPAVQNAAARARRDTALDSEGDGLCPGLRLGMDSPSPWATS
jgi:hypothetical protein